MVGFPVRLPGFVLLPTYLRAASALIDDEAQRRIERALIVNPESGPMIAGTGGVRKVRVGIGACGKRGGLRVIYFYRPRAGRIYLITAYAKNERADLTMAQRKDLR